MGGRKQTNFLKGNEKEKFDELVKDSRNLQDLVYTECFTVEKVLAENEKVMFSPGPTRVGGRNPQYEMGNKSKLTLKVKPDNNIPINYLTFEGSRPPIVSGNYIQAKIPAYKENPVKDPYQTGIGPGPNSGDRILYFERPFEERESAIEIATFSDDGKEIVSKDRSVGYYDFFPKQE